MCLSFFNIQIDDVVLFYEQSFDTVYLVILNVVHCSEETRKTTHCDHNFECDKPTSLGWHCKSMLHFVYKVLLFSEIWFSIFCCAANHLLGYVGGIKYFSTFFKYLFCFFIWTDHISYMITFDCFFFLSLQHAYYLDYKVWRNSTHFGPVLPHVQI